MPKAPADLAREGAQSDGPQVFLGIAEPEAQPVPQSVAAIAADEPPVTPRVDVPSVPKTAAAEAAAALDADADAALAEPAISEPVAVTEPSSLEPVVTSAAESDPYVERNADEISIPPVVPAAIELGDEEFFEAGERASIVAAQKEEEETAWNPALDKQTRKSMPYVVARRERFSRVVKWVAGGAAVVCALAVARVLAPGHAAVAPAAVTVNAAAAPLLESVPNGNAPAKAETPKVEGPKVEAPKAEEPKADEAKSAAPEVPQPTATEAAKPAVDPSTAKADKDASRKSLERGKLADAIEAGERSVTADPTDGEAWLILGAAYQEKGQLAEARRCYKSCLDEGKRGPKGECAAMLR